MLSYTWNALLSYSWWFGVFAVYHRNGYMDKMSFQQREFLRYPQTTPLANSLFTQYMKSALLTVSTVYPPLINVLILFLLKSVERKAEIKTRSALGGDCIVGES